MRKNQDGWVEKLKPVKERQQPGLILKAISTGFYRSVGQLLETKYPEQMKKWDNWDYRIWSPLSLEDEARVEVHLINKDKSIQKVVLAL